MLSHYKESLQGAADPVARLLFQARVRPNQLTVVGLGVSMVAAQMFFLGRLRLAAVLLALAGLCDFFDGSLARLAGSESPYGAFLDSVVDRYSDLIVLLGIVLYYERVDEPASVFFTMVTLLGTVMVSYTKARAQSIGVSCEIGLMERPERMILLVAGGAFQLLTAAMIALAILTNLTALQRIFYVWKITRDRSLR